MTKADDFDTFWAAYPNRKAKADARKAWTQTEKIRPPIEAIIGAIESAKQSNQWRKDGGEYIPLPASWLRGERWEDEHEIVIERPIVKSGWKMSDAGTIAHGNELGVFARAGESMSNYRVRLDEIK